MKLPKIKLPYISFKEDLGPLLDLKVLVVSFFGKSAYNILSSKAGLVDNLLGQQILKTSVLDNVDVDPETLCNIEGYYDSKQNVLYLQLCGVFDTHTLIKQYERLLGELEEKGYLSVWAQLKHGYARSLLFLFSISHILILSHPSQSFDISYIHLFRALEHVRLIIQPFTSELLGQINGLNPDWAFNGRPCSPRVLFLFQSCPSAFRKKSKNGRSMNIKKLEHAIEDQIYNILRKSRIITNFSSNSLFAIPANQEFVYVETVQGGTFHWVPYLVDSLVDLCKMGPLSNENLQFGFGYESLKSESHSSSSDHSFQKFLQQHIDQAFHKGFDDNVGRHPPTNTFFVIPTLGVLMEAIHVLYNLIIKSGYIEKFASANSILHNLLDTDVKFSEARCSKVLPLAIATYQENLPPHYTKGYHERRVCLATHTTSVICNLKWVEIYFNISRFYKII
uniref:Nonsense-mediated mRNA decay factor SMG8 n=1 Tax=Clastoptera arizonana TaxID=38151 RepID=A0A1B6D313_9HEMI